MAISVGVDGYCVLADIQSKNQQRTYSASTTPTSGEVEAFITDGFYDLNAALDAIGTTTPVASSAVYATRWLKISNILYAASEAEDATYSAGGEEERGRAEEMKEQYAARVEMLLERTVTLKDASDTDDTPEAKKDETFGGQFNLDADGDERDPIFTRTMNF